MNWTKTLAYSLGLSVAFFFYFAYFVADKWSLWAIYEIGPLLTAIKTEYGQPYSRALGQAVAFIVLQPSSFHFATLFLAGPSCLRRPSSSLRQSC